MLFQLFVNIKNLCTRCVKACKQLTANNQNINFAINKLVFDGVFVIIRIAVLRHHFVPESDNHIVSTFVYFFTSFSHIGSGNNDRSGKISELFKAFLIADRILFEIARQHCFESGVFVAFNKVQIYIQCNALDSCICGGQTFDSSMSL